jgi:hypothetical protein
MNDMTLEEARRRLERLTLCPVESDDGDIAALRVILAALPAPEPRTPGQTFVEARGHTGDHYPRWETIADSAQRSIEAGAIAVLREHAVDFVLGGDMINFIRDLPTGRRTDDVCAAVQARLAEVKP